MAIMTPLPDETISGFKTLWEEMHVELLGMDLTFEKSRACEDNDYVMSREVVMAKIFDDLCLHHGRLVTPEEAADGALEEYRAKYLARHKKKPSADQCLGCRGRMKRSWPSFMRERDFFLLVCSFSKAIRQGRLVLLQNTDLDIKGGADAIALWVGSDEEKYVGSIHLIADTWPAWTKLLEKMGRGKLVDKAGLPKLILAVGEKETSMSTRVVDPEKTMCGATLLVQGKNDFWLHPPQHAMALDEWMPKNEKTTEASLGGTEAGNELIKHMLAARKNNWEAILKTAEAKASTRFEL
jgi:hypothetical protein